MLEQILELVKQSGQQSVVNNPEVPNADNNAVMAEAAKTITGGLQNVVSGGGLQSILSLFTGGNAGGQANQGIMGNPIVSMMVGHLTNNLASKFNLNPAIANSVANNIIPSVLNSLISKTRSNAPEDAGFNLNDLISSFTGGQSAQPAQAGGGAFDFQGLLNQVSGGNGGGSAIGGIADIIGKVAQQSQQNQQQSGGLGGLIQSFFK